MAGILLQAALAAGPLLLVCFGIFLLIGGPILIGIFMKFIWRKRNKEEYITNNTPYYKDPIWFFPSLVLSIIILGCIFCASLFILDKIYPVQF